MAPPNLEKEIKTLKNKLDRERGENQKLRDQLQVKNHELDASERRVKNTESLQRTATKNLLAAKSQTAALETRASSTDEQLLEEVQNLRQENQGLQESLKKAGSRIGTLVVDREPLRASRDQLRSELDEMTQKYEGVSGEVGKLRDSRDHVIAQARSLRKDKRALREALEEAETRFESLSKDQEHLLASCDETRHQLDDMAEKLDKFSKKYMMTERVYQEVKTRVEDDVAERAGSEEELPEKAYKNPETGDRRVKQLIGNYDELVKRNKELREQCEMTKQESVSTFVESSTGEEFSAEQMVERYNALNKKHEDLIQEHDAMVEQHDNSRHDYEALEEEHNVWGQDYNNLVQTHKDSMAKEEETNNALEATELKHEDLSRAHNQLLLTHQHLTFQHENNLKALEAEQASNVAYRGRIMAMIQEQSQLIFTWTSQGLPVQPPHVHNQGLPPR